MHEWLEWMRNAYIFQVLSRRLEPHYADEFMKIALNRPWSFAYADKMGEILLLIIHVFLLLYGP